MRFLDALFRRLGAGPNDALDAQEPNAASCSGSLEQAVEHVVERTSGRLRAVANYAPRLREPVLTALRAIDGMVEQIPGVTPCHRASYANDAAVNAFFVDHASLRGVFSDSREVRDLFDDHAEAAQCFALLCMHREERRQLGMALEGDRLRKDLLQTTVSFTDHQVVSPGLAEGDARCALKCCIFNSLLAHIHKRADDALSRADDLKGRAQAWRARLQRHPEGSPAHAAVLQELEKIERIRAAQPLQLDALEDHFRYLTDSLSQPENIIGARRVTICLDRMGVKHDAADGAGTRAVALSEIRIADQPARVACLVSFPRSELLPERDFLREASLFLAT